MTTTQSIFLVFFAIFWGSIASVQGRWKMFHWTLIRYRHVAVRLCLSVLTLNILPVLFFALILSMLRCTPATSVNQWTDTQVFTQVLLGVAPAFAVFGFYRFWLSLVEFWPTYFYQFKVDQDDITRRIEPSLDELILMQENAPWNFAFALIYLVLAGGIPLLLIGNCILDKG